MVCLGKLECFTRENLRKKVGVHGSSKMEVSFLVKRTEFALLTAVLFTKNNHFA